MSSISTSTAKSTLVSVSNNQVVTTSNAVANQFGKQHSHVLRSIESLISQLPKNHASNFGLMVVEVEIGSGAIRKDPAYEMTRDGFTLLAMGFTGKKALQFKLAYIDAFNAMEAELLRISNESRQPYAVNQKDTLTAAQAEELRLALKQRCDLLPKASQAAFMIKGWSRLKAHFGVTYRQIPQSEFTEALSLVTRHASEWELLDAPEVPSVAEKKYSYPKELLLQKYFCPKDESGNLLLPKLDLRTFANDKFVSPIKALLTEMHADGHNVDAAYAEFAAMQFGIKALDDQLSMLSMIGTGAGNSALKILFRE